MKKKKNKKEEEEKKKKTQPKVLHLAIRQVATDDMSNALPREVVLEPAPMLQHVRLELLVRGNCEPVNKNRDPGKDALSGAIAAGIAAVRGGGGGGGGGSAELRPKLPVLFRHVAAEIWERGLLEGFLTGGRVFRDGV